MPPKSKIDFFFLKPNYYRERKEKRAESQLDFDVEGDDMYKNSSQNFLVPFSIPSILFFGLWSFKKCQFYNSEIKNCDNSNFSQKTSSKILKKLNNQKHTI